MRDAYEDVGRTTALSTANIATSIAHDVDRNIELLDLSLQAAAQSWGNPQVQSLPPGLQNLILFDNAARAQDFGAILVLDANGRARASSVATPLLTGSFADRDYFLVHKASNNIGLFVSQPFISRISKDWTLGLSRRLTTPDGSFDGIVVGTIKLSYLDRLFKGVDLGKDGVAGLIRIDGTIVSRFPIIESDIHRNVRNTDAFSPMRSSKLGTLSGASVFDGKDRVVAFHRVGDLPLIEVVEISAAEAYAAWWHKAVVLGGILALICVTALCLLVVLEKELTKRLEAEQKLEHMARTDPLTTLANRREFEEVLAREWGRAVRSSLDLALLIVDADHFKAYNDNCGHPAGDETLRLIAGCIRSGIHRPGDLACRIGGEEFAVVLPETDAAGAIAVGETIRASICALKRPHPGSPLAIVTVSLGAASTGPTRTQTSEQLIERADQALYLAKNQGRNCVRVSHLQKPVSLVA